MKRLERRPDRLGRGDGRRAAPPSAAARAARTAANLRDVGVNVDLAPVLDVARPGGDIAATERGFGSTAGRVAATAIPFAAALQAGGVAATAKHFPGLGAARDNTDFAVQRIGLSKATLRRGRRGALPALRRRRRRDGDAQHRDLPGLLAEARPPSPGRSPPASCARGSASRASRSPTRSDSVAVARLRRPGQGRPGRGPGRHRPAPLHRPGSGAAAGAGPCCASCARASSTAPSSRPRPAGARLRQLAGRARSLPGASSRIAGWVEDAHAVARRRPWPRTSPRRPRRRPSRS